MVCYQLMIITYELGVGEKIMKLLLTKSIKHKAFTLIELLVVVAIIGILAAVGVVAYSGYTSGAKKAAANANHKAVVKYITNEIMNEKGQDIKETLMKFKRDLSNSTFLVAHNLDFDTSIVSVELLRNGLRNVIYYYRGQKCCTMRETKRLFRNKWPKLVDLHYKLFRKKPKNLHNSLIDVFVCFRCYCQYYYDFDPVKDKTHFKKDHPKNIEFMNIYNKIL